MCWLSALSMLGFLATDMYLPAFESIRIQLATSQAMTGLTLSVFLFGMAIGQLIYGPLSDNLGRIKVLAGGMVMFALASAACYFSTSIEMLLVARFLQALGACSASVIWQAIVIDRFDNKTAQNVFATIMPLVALSPALAPLLGAAIETWAGWRSIFIVLILLGIILFITTLRQLETAPKLISEMAIHKRIIGDYKRILSSRKFMGNMIIFASCSAAFFAWLTGSPFVMSSMGYSGTDIGLSYVPQTIAFIIGGYSCRSLLNKYDGAKLLPWFVALFLVSNLAIFFISMSFSFNTIWPVLIPFCFLAVANGACYPIVVNKALEDLKECSATASGVLNFLQTMVCFIASSIVSTFAAQGMIAVSSVMCGAAVGIAIGFFLSSNASSFPLKEATKTP